MAGRVVDASVLAAIVFNEPEADFARASIRGFELVAPPLLAYELANVAWKKVRLRPHDEHRLTRALTLGLSLDVRWEPVDHVSVLRLAIRSGLSTYDASYLYVARALGLALVTFDTRLQAAHERLNRESRAPDEPNERRPRP